MPSNNELISSNCRISLAQQFAELPDSGLADTAQTAAFLNCSEAKLERDRWAGGGIPYLKLNRSVRYRKSDVMAYLDGALRRSTSDGVRGGAR